MKESPKYLRDQAGECYMVRGSQIFWLTEADAWRPYCKIEEIDMLGVVEVITVDDIN